MYRPTFGGHPPKPTCSLFTFKANIPICAAYKEARALSKPLKERRIPVLYSHTQCPYAHRVWLALIEKHVDHETVHVDLSKKPSWYFSIHPSGLVPAFRHEGQTYVESVEINKFVDMAFSGPLLMPEDPERYKQAQDLLDRAETLCLSGLAYIGGVRGPWAIGNLTDLQGKSAFDETVQELNRSILRSGGPYLTGQTVTQADLALFPFFWRFEIILRNLLQRPREYGDAVNQWLLSMSERESCRVSNPDPALLLEAYRRHERMDFFDYTTYTVDELHPDLIQSPQDC